jgi:carboxypeptidase C (cathepsin A)
VKYLRRIAVCLLIAIAFLILKPAAPAQETRPPAPAAAAAAEPHKDTDKDKDKDALPIPPEKTVATHHELALGGKTLKYTATAGTLLIRDEEDKPYGSMFYVAYTLDGA